MSEEFWHSHDDAARLPKVVYAAVHKGKDPTTGRAKMHVRICTSKTDAKKTVANWLRLGFGEVKFMATTVAWEEME